MDSNTNNTDTSQSTNKVVSVWRWLTESNTRVAGVFLLGMAFVLILGLIALITSQKPVRSKKEITIPQPTPSPTLDQNSTWTEISNSNGFKLKYSTGSTLNPTLPQATQSASLQITSINSTLAVEVTDKKQSLKEAVERLREKNATSSADIKVNKILTKPISILYGGNEGYEWYLESNGLAGLNLTFSSRLGKNRVIQFEKGNKHYLIFSSFDKEGEQILSTLRLGP